MIVGHESDVKGWWLLEGAVAGGTRMNLSST